MQKSRLKIARLAQGRSSDRKIRPCVEGLESRLLLYSQLGDQWTYDSRITYSFMPDGTSVGGVPSALFQTLNANYSTPVWQQQIEEAAALWENATNANLALVSDGGEPVGTSGDQQDDPRFGDIRIGAVPLPGGVLAETFLPPPANGGTAAGDILLNSNINWQINSNYDLQTVVAHEFGHALGLGESSVSTAVMYGTYNGIKQSLASDDIAGIDSIYGTRQFDQFNTGGHRNNLSFTATNINSYIDGNLQIAIPGLDITTTGDSEWYFVNVPSGTSGTMTVTVQSTNLSSLSPSVAVYSSSLTLVGQATAPGSLGATITVSSSVQSGQGYYVKVLAAGGPGPIGGYGLLLNFGNQSQAPIPPPNTVVTQQGNQGGGVTNNAVAAISPSTGPIVSNGQTLSGAPVFTAVGSIDGWVEMMTAPAALGPVTSGPYSASSPSTATGSSSNVPTSLVTVSSATQDQATNSTVLLGPLPVTSSVATVASVATGPGQAIVQAVDDALDQWDGR